MKQPILITMTAKSAIGISFTRETNPDINARVMERTVACREIDLEGAVREHYKQVYRFALHMTRHPEDAAYLTQYAYEALSRKHHTIQDPSKVRSWLQSTVYRKFVDQKRRIIRFPHIEFDELHEQHSTAGPDSASKIDAKAALEALYKLEDDLRAPLVLFYLESHSYKEIADILQLPVGTIMSRLYRGKAKLFEILIGEEK